MRSAKSLAALILLLGACGSETSTITEQTAQPMAAAAVNGAAGAPASVGGTSVATSSVPSVTPSVIPGAPSSAKPAETKPATETASATPAASTTPATPTTPDAPAAGGGSAGWCGVKQTLDARCTVCHNEQKAAGAPMSLMTYADLNAPAVSDPSRKVYELVQERVHDKMRPMPPQNPLDDQQLAGIDAWVAGGAASGADLTCADNMLPAETDAASRWPEHCDETYVIRAAPETAKQRIAAGAEVHPQIMITPPWGDEEVQAIAWHSLNDNVKVLHHWILYGPQGEFLFGWAPGKDYNEPLPEDAGVFLPNGVAQMRLDMHYNNIAGTTEEEDASGVEVCVLKKANFRPKTATVAQSLTQLLISVPPRATNQEVTGTCNHSGAPVRLLSVSPHAHKNAHHMKFTVERANGETLVMHDMPFNFEEQTTYALDPPVVVEAGDRIVTTCTFSNDTDQVITFGENTGNEMCFNFALYEPMGGLSCGVGGFPRF
jgi:hypothetical protein